MSVIIIESPGKKKSIEKYTGATVIPTFGHMKDLPKKELGVNLDTFEGTFIPKDARQASFLKNLVNQCRGQDVYIATDADREGEAIAAMVYQEIKNVCKSCYRSVFGEITEKVVQNSIANAIPFSEFDWNAYYSFLGRRIGDRLVGYLLSGIVHNAAGWSAKAKDKKDFMSVGRVQTIAVKAIVERKIEIDNFVPIPYIDIEASFSKEGKSFVGKHIGNGFKDLALAKTILDSLADTASGVVSSVEKKPAKSKPKPPYITSSIQAHASSVLGLSGKQTMFILQKLYEGFGDGGIITYHRTDSPMISQEYSNLIGSYLSDKYSSEYSGVVSYKSKQSQAEAHECIRPVSSPYEYEEVYKKVYTGLESVKKGLGDKGVKLFKMICLRTLASQLDPAVYDRTSIIINVAEQDFKVTGSILTKQGHLILKQENEEGEADSEDSVLPDMKIGDVINISEITGKNKETSPPSEYTEPSLIKKLEKEGIGRPSTYATIVDVLFTKNYAIKTKGKKTFTPTPKAFSLIAVMDDKYQFLVDFKFTALLEEDLDLVAKGELAWQEAMKKLYLQMGSPVVGSRTPTENMLKAARNISKSASEPFNEELSSDFAYVSSYLTKNMKKTPSEAQLNFAYSIEKRTGITLPNNAKMDYTILNKWINKNKDQVSLNLSEKQVAIVEKYAPDDIVAKLSSDKPADKRAISKWMTTFFKKK